MALPVHLQGNRWRLNRGDGATPEVFKLLCTVVTSDLDQKIEFDDAMVLDCDNPTALPQRVSTPKGQTWDVTGAGKCDAQRFATLQGDFTSATPRNYQFVTDLPALQGGGTRTGPAFLDSLKLTKTENGVVSFSFTMKGQGTLVWAPAAT